MGLSQSSGQLAESIECQRCPDRRATGNWRIKGRGRAVPTRRNAAICPLKSLMIPPSCEMKHGGAMEGDDAGIGHRDARAMLDAFASVGATRFDVTWTTCAGEKEWFRRGMSFDDLARNLPRMLDEAPSKQRNVIVRPHGPAVTFIQLDDLAPATLARLAPAVFLTLQTSPGNFQAWVAMAGLDDNDFARRLRKGAGADPTASGATRVAGSLNFKDKYAPNFPRVAIGRISSGQLTTASALRGLGLVAEQETPSRRVSRRSARALAQAIGYGRAIRDASKARRPIATRAAPTSAGRISCFA